MDDELTENQKIYLLSLAAFTIVICVHSIHVHIEEAMKRKFLAKHGELLKKVTESDLYKKATVKEKIAIIKEFESAGNLFKK